MIENRKNLDANRHFRMWKIAMASVDRGSKILVCGDGRNFSDSLILRALGFTNVDASSLSLEGCSHRLVSEFNAFELDLENLEDIDRIRGVYDVVVVKESLHHLRRPLEGLISIGSAANIRCIAIEPCDRSLSPAIFSALFYAIQSWRGRLSYHEPEGNFLYCFSRREVEKYVRALLPHFFYLKTFYFNDLYLESAKASDLSFLEKLFINCGRLLYNQFCLVCSALQLLKTTHIVIDLQFEEGKA